MVDTQHFCLRWNNYQSSITSAFENLRDDEDFVDVTLACDGKSLKAHRVVLSACSPYFRELLKSTPCKHPVIVLQDVAFSDLHALVEFIYHGEVNVHQRSLSSFLKTAEVLRVSGLTQQADSSDRDELSQVRALAARGGGNNNNNINNNNNVPQSTPTPHDKMSDEGFPRGGSPPTPNTPTPTTVQQLLRRAQIRRNERRSPDDIHDDTIKRSRIPSPPLNNNDATPTDFSMVKNHLSNKIEGNGIHDENSRIEESIKCEPLELTGGNGGISGHNEDSSDSGAAASDRPPASASSNEHDHEPPEHPSTPSYMPESKLFTSTPGSFNFSMAALTTDHNPLSGLGHGLQTPDLAGTSQDREVVGEDGGWQSTTTIDNRRDEYDGVNQDLPIIDLLHDITDDITFKDEPMSPKIDDINNCLLEDDIKYQDMENLTTTTTNKLNNKYDNNDDSSMNIDNDNNTVLLQQRPSNLTGTYCKFCNKSFSRAWSLQRHLADTHFYVPQSLVCDLCGRNYKSRNSLISHKSQYHAKKERKDNETTCF